MVRREDGECVRFVDAVKERSDLFGRGREGNANASQRLDGGVMVVLVRSIGRWRALLMLLFP